MDQLNKLKDTLKPSPSMPVFFIGHGNPMNAIDDNSFTQNWKKCGADLPTPQAVVVISAHWLTSGTFVTDAPTQPIIYDIYGFPPELYEVKYPAIGSPEIAETLRQNFLNYEAKLDNSWGLDHGTWSVLVHMLPEPKIPILQISLDMSQTLEQSLEMFSLLRGLRRKGVVFIGSGNIVHNLGMLNFVDDKVFGWAEEFDTVSAAAIMNRDLKSLANPFEMTDAAKYAVQFDDHYRPMLAAAALLNRDEEIEYFNDKIVMGSLSMRAFRTARVV
jgi:4,5-DOPA dioxygenase extradiol